MNKKLVTTVAVASVALFSASAFAAKFSIKADIVAQTSYNTKTVAKNADDPSAKFGTDAPANDNNKLFTTPSASDLDHFYGEDGGTAYKDGTNFKSMSTELLTGSTHFEASVSTDDDAATMFVRLYPTGKIRLHANGEKDAGSFILSGSSEFDIIEGLGQDEKATMRNNEVTMKHKATNVFVKAGYTNSVLNDVVGYAEGNDDFGHNNGYSMYDFGTASRSRTNTVEIGYDYDNADAPDNKFLVGFNIGTASTDSATAQNVVSTVGTSVIADRKVTKVDHMQYGVRLDGTFMKNLVVRAQYEMYKDTTNKDDLKSKAKGKETLTAAVKEVDRSVIKAGASYKIELGNDYFVTPYVNFVNSTSKQKMNSVASRKLDDKKASRTSFLVGANFGMAQYGLVSLAVGQESGKLPLESSMVSDIDPLTSDTYKVSRMGYEVAYTYPMSGEGYKAHVTAFYAANDAKAKVSQYTGASKVVHKAQDYKYKESSIGARFGVSF